jgi:hypothetical protein
MNPRALAGRRLVESEARRLARNWRARRGLRVRDLDPRAVDCLRAWAEAAARLQLADDRGSWGERYTVAAQNSEARLLTRLEAAVAKARVTPVEEELRKLLEDR